MIALNREVRCYFYIMKCIDMKSLLTSAGLVLFYPIWLICALLSDICGLLCTPFDTQRLINTYIQTIRNGQQLGAIWDPIPKQPQPQNIRKIGFEGKPPEQPAEILGPVC